ncbi:DMT family transporter [Dongia sedimenti]|uniref:DMT family transporter n=1 Tax=Dongia sedimenti TaxID=3064282 RepID=A0ABU0YN39_9PROT|nr:DMT family transporter [Rhodospirillaceae bacterium R-7]
MTGNAAQTWAASAGVALVGAAWGIYWLPLRQLQALGIGGEWATAGIFIACLPVALPLAFLARREIRAHLRLLIWLGLANGAAFSLYSNAYAHTSVFNVIFLFYLSPVWSVLIARFWQGERVGAARMGCVALGLAGLVAMLSADGGWPIPRNLGDWMALTCGLVWAVTAIAIRRNEHIGVAANAVAFFLGGLGPALLLALLSGATHVPDRLAVAAGWPWLVGIAWLGWIPAQLLLFWGVKRISPVRTGILLMTELISGALTAAWLSGDPFGWPQVVGGAMIVLAGIGDMATSRDGSGPAPIPAPIAPES